MNDKTLAVATRVLAKRGRFDAWKDLAVEAERAGRPFYVPPEHRARWRQWREHRARMRTVVERNQAIQDRVEELTRLPQTMEEIAKISSRLT